MLEGDTSVQSGSGSGEGASAPSTGAENPTGSLVGSEAGGSGSLASGDGGSAPAVAVDAALDPNAQGGQPSAQQISEFLFANRKWQSQKHAEDFVRTQDGRAREAQRKVAEYEAKLAEREQTVQALQRALSTGVPGQGQGQGAANGPAAPAGEHSFAEELVKSGDLQFITGLLQDPNQGVEKFTVALADRMDRAFNERLQRMEAEKIQPFIRQAQFEKEMGSTMGIARQLGQQFPELDNANQSPEAVEHQQAFIETLKQLPPEFVRANPEVAFQMVAAYTRHQYGTPVFAQPPGTSGSPSARAALASEEMLAQAISTPAVGTGTPRPRPAGAPESPEDRIRRENAAVQGNFRSPSGRDLGFGPA
jgi:hypothetical protein